MILNWASTIAAKDNPFASHRVEAVTYRFAEADWNSHIQRLVLMNWRGAIVGDQGSGKTTLMLEMKSRLNEGIAGEMSAYYCFVSRDSQEHAKELEQLFLAASCGSVLLVDGIERLSWFLRRRLLRCEPERTRLVVTAHGTIGLPLWLHCQTDWPLMQSVLEALVDSPDESLIQATLRLFKTHRGNIRDVLRSLYDLWSAGTFTQHRECAVETRYRAK